ncbi:BMP family ABC transporter substrate-binding protein, partial [Candidatus Bathyarchaeota archaeon]
EGAVELGCDYGMPINPKFEAPLKSVWVIDKVSGQNMTVYDLVFLRLEQMSSAPAHVQIADENGNLVWITPDVPFDPFMGPLYDQDGNLRVPAGERLGHDDLWEMMWFVEWMVGTIPSA